jgi:hypothetical protein
MRLCLIFLPVGKYQGTYSTVKLCFDGKDVDQKIHRLVGKAFVFNPDNKPQINHKNGIKTDCRACNLEWVTARENLQHACDMGLKATLSYQEKISCSSVKYSKLYPSRKPS